MSYIVQSNFCFPKFPVNSTSYTLIQAISSFEMMETKNVGSIFICPEFDFVDITIINSFGRHKNCFKNTNVDLFVCTLKQIRENILNFLDNKFDHTILQDWRPAGTNLFQLSPTRQAFVQTIDQAKQASQDIFAKCVIGS